MNRIVILGATSGIGLEIAKLYIAAGWQVGAAGRRTENLEALRAAAGTAGDVPAGTAGRTHHRGTGAL